MYLTENSEKTKKDMLFLNLMRVTGFKNVKMPIYVVLVL